MHDIDSTFADRIHDVPRSFIREILKVTLDPDVISFAGGLPNRAFFPVDALKAATCKVLDREGADVLQYGNSEGYAKLRELIAARYRKTAGLDIPADQILITSGSQQGLDLLGKVLLNDNDPLVIEEPGYLGAIQALSLYRPQFIPVPVSSDGMDPQILHQQVETEHPKLIYTVPNFQNPSGLSYTADTRRQVAEILQASNTILIEDNPYGELRFAGNPKPSFYDFMPDQTVLLGSFSKCVAPGFRLGWIVAPDALMQKLVIAKQATDLHTSHLTQSIVCQYFYDNDLDQHIATIRKAYGRQCRAMLDAIGQYFPADIHCTEPEGGMFLWAELPEDVPAMALFDQAVDDRVVFVPSAPFYVEGRSNNAMRLNFSCADEPTIETGIRRLGNAIRRIRTLSIHEGTL